MTIKQFKKYLEKNKEEYTFIVKSKTENVEGFYQFHWYFQSPHSPYDFQDKNTMNNSYHLHWQLLKTDQFCNGFALFGALQTKKWWEQHKKNPFGLFKPVADIPVEISGKSYEKLAGKIIISDK